MTPKGQGDSLNAQAQVALNLLQQGRTAQAEEICLQILATNPRHFHGLHLLGIVALQKPDGARAVRLFHAAIESEPSQPAAWSNLAAALLGVDQPSAALVACDRALDIDPSLTEALVNRGHALAALDRAQESLSVYQRALRVSPQHLNAQIGAGKVLRKLESYEESLTHYEQAHRLNPKSPDILVDIGQTLLLLNRPEAALEPISAALRLNSTSAAALSAQGGALRRLQRPLEALASFEAALRIQPGLPDVHSNMANVYFQIGRLEDSLHACDQALALNPTHTQAMNIRSHVLRGLDRLEEAAVLYDRLIALAPDFDYARGNRLYLRALICDWSDYAAEVAAIQSAVAAGKRACLPMSFLAFCPDADLQLACARIVTADRHPAQKAHRGPPRARRDRLRIAYVSSDFKDHPVAYLLAGVLENHNRGRFEIHALSIENERSDTAIRDRIRAAVDHYEDVHHLSDRQIAARLGELDIDIAVDLNGHTQSGRLGIFATHPVAVQVGFLGYTGTTGASYLDYLLADEIALPAGLESGFSERIERLPYCFLPSDDRQTIATVSDSREAMGLPADGFVYCAFNSPYKINPTMFDVWMRLLSATAGSVLWLKGGRPSIMENLRREACARGIDPGRLVFAPQMPRMDEHLARYRCADLFLDTVPYGAHATSRDALWAGLPVLTCAGRAFASRVAASLLLGLGLPELVAGSLDDYAARAVRLANTPTELLALRAWLARSRTTGPIFNTERYCRGLETAFESIFERHLMGVLRQSIAVTDQMPAAGEPKERLTSTVRAT